MKNTVLAALCCLAFAPLSRAEGEVSTIRRPGPWHHVNNRAHVGIPSVAISPKNGRMWATWYAGVTPGEDSNNYVVLATSADGGQTWKEVLVADPDGIGPLRSFDPEVWVAPDGLLRWTWTERKVPLQSQAESAYAGAHSNPCDDELMMVALSAEDEPAGEFPSPKHIGRGIMMCKPIVANDGRWLLPIAHWYEEPSACVLETTNGVDFVEVGGATLAKKERLFDEHTMVQRADGALWMLIRTRTGFSESLSKDGGRTWDECVPSGLGHPSARLFLRRLASGRLLLVKHGAIGEKTGRTKLMAFLSEDDGVTWQGGLLLDGRSGVSYPDGDQFADGRIAVVYDYSRTKERLVLMAVFTEEDILAGRNVSGKLALHKVVSSRDESDPDWTGVDPRLGRSLDPDGRTLWVDGRRIERGGRPFVSAPPYARLPHKFEGRLSPQTIHVGQDSAGVSFNFVSDASRLVFEWSLLRAPAAKPPHPDANRNGIDVYGRGEKGGWEFVANGASVGRFGNRLEMDWLPGRECRVYLPACNGLRDFRVGVARGASVVPPTPVAGKPIVFFGSDNFQGASASRPGLVLSAAVGRLLDAPTINLGFVGVTAPEPAFLELLASIDAAAYVFDSAWIAPGAKITLAEWARELKKARPDAKVIFAADHLPSGGDFMLDCTRLNDFGLMEGARAIVAALGGAGSRTSLEATKPEVAKQEDSKPAVAKPEEAKREEVKSGVVKPAVAKLADAKAKDAKPERAKPATEIKKNPKVDDVLPGLEYLMKETK